MTERVRNMPLWLIGLLAVGTILALTVIIFSGVHRTPFEPSSVTVKADFSRAAQIHEGDQVRLEGEDLGKVGKIEPGVKGEEARVSLEVEEDAGPIYADASARLRFKTLLGGSFYVDLDRGTESTGELADGAVIPSSRTDVQVEIEDVTSIFRDEAVSGLQTLPGELATAIEDPDQLPLVFRTTDDVADEAGTAVNALRGQEQDVDLKRLVRETARTVGALDADTSELNTLVQGVSSTLATTGAHGDDIREIIQNGPDLTDKVERTLTDLTPTINIARGLISRLQPAAPEIDPTLSRLRPTLVNTDHLLDEAKPLLRLLRPTVGSLVQAGQSGSPFIDGLQPALRRTDEVILPYLGRPDPITGHTTTVMIGGNASTFTGISAQQDQNGHFVRFPASIGTASPSAYLPCTSNFIDGGANALLVCDSLNTAISEYMSYFAALDPVNPGAGAP